MKDSVFVEMEERAVLDIVEDLYAQCRVVETGLQCHRSASRLRRAHGFSYWDSLIVSAALESGCRILYSEDMQHGQVVEQRLRIVNPLLAVSAARPGRARTPRDSGDTG